MGGKGHACKLACSDKRVQAVSAGTNYSFLGGSCCFGFTFACFMYKVELLFPLLVLLLCGVQPT